MARKAKPMITDARFGDRDFFKDRGRDETQVRRPFRQHPDTAEVDRFMGHTCPLEFLATSMTRSEAPDPDDRYSVMAEAASAEQTIFH